MRFARFLRHPFLLYPRASLVATLLLALPWLWQLSRFEISSELRILLEGDQRNLASYQKVRQILADVEMLVLSVEGFEVFSPEGIETVRRISEAFLRQPGVEDVKSLTHSYKPVRQGLGFQMVPLAPSQAVSPGEMARLRDFCLNHPLVRNVMVAPDGRHTLITVTYRRPLESPAAQRAWRREVEAVLAPFRAEGFQFHCLALPLIEEEIRATLQRDIAAFVPAAIALLIAVLWLTFRSWRVLGMVLLYQVAVLLLLPAAIQMGGFHLNVFSIMLLPLLAGVHLTMLAHLFAAFGRAQATHRDVDDALRETLGLVLKPTVFATMTTMIGLSSLVFSSVATVREFGLLGASGLALIFGLTFGPGLAALKLAGHSWLGRAHFEAVHSAPSNAPQAGFARLAGFAQAHRQVIVALAAVAVLFTLVGARFLRTDIRAVEFLHPRSPTRQAVEALDRVYGGINVVQLEFDTGAPDGIHDLRLLRYLMRVQRYAEAQSETSAAYSYAQLMAMMNQLWEGERPGSFRLPETPLLVNLFVLALKTQSLPFLTALADPTCRTAYLVLRTRDMPADAYLGLVHRVLDYAERAKPPGVRVSAARGLHSILEANRRILRSQVSSASLTLGVIGLVLTLLWRSVWLAGLSLVTNAIPVGFVIAVAGCAGVTLNSITVMVAAISLGIVVDDSIHFITHWCEERRRGAPPATAVMNTLELKGGPMIWTSVILIAICSVFWFSSFPPVIHFGLLSAVAFVVALASVLCFLPTVLLWATARREPFP